MTPEKISIPLLLLVALVLAACSGEKAAPRNDTKSDTPNVVRLTPAAAQSAGIVVEPVKASILTGTSRFTGAVEPNQQQLQQVSALTSGRIEQVFAKLGDFVRAGSVVATVSSPEVAQIHGKLLEAEARLNLAEANLRRTKRLAELGAAAGKDLNAALAEADTARYDLNHLRDELRILGAPDDEKRRHDIAAVRLIAPISGVITERLVNPGSGVEAGKPLLTIANLSTVWVIANVPESQVSQLRIGASADVRAASLGTEVLRGTVSYIDPVLNEATRTARVRIDVQNPGGRLKVGTFVDVAIANAAVGQQALVVPDDAVQRMRDGEVVFVQSSDNSFTPRRITLGDRIDGHRVVLAGLTAGERIVTKGGFAVKSQMLKGEMSEDD